MSGRGESSHAAGGETPDEGPRSNAAVGETPDEGASSDWSHRLRFQITNTAERKPKAGKRAAKGAQLAEHVRAWVEKKVADGVPEKECVFPFLNNAPRMVECCTCRKSIYPGEEVVCSVNDCEKVYHKTCATEKIRLHSLRSFKCPQHACFICRTKSHRHCVCCDMAIDTKGAPGGTVCSKHPTDWRLDNQHADPTSDIEEIFNSLPLPYVNEEFKIDLLLEDVLGNELEPVPYVLLSQNAYLVKKEHNVRDAAGGCKTCNADSTCRYKCECRSLSISCSKACYCKTVCQNRPFHKAKKIKIVKAKFCGWGGEALESMQKGDFIIEYIGEVIDDALCEQRLRDNARRKDKNFYMCKIQKDFTIDSTFRGNDCRFINHSCDPNCELEKWQVNGGTRVGLFASRSIEVGESLSYNYRFLNLGEKIKCLCGAPNCRGFI